MRRTKEEAAITREQLLDAALVSFAKKGYAGTTLDDIAGLADITRGAIHWHFGSKAELFNTLVRERYKRVAQRFWNGSMKGGTPLQVLRTTLERWISYPEEDADFKAILELVLLKSEVGPGLEEGLEERIQGMHSTQQHFAALIQQGTKSGEIRPEVDPEKAALAALGLVNGVVSIWILDPAALSLKALAGEVIDIFVRGIATG